MKKKNRKNNMLKLINSAVNFIRDPMAISRDAKIKMKGVDLSSNCPVIVRCNSIIIATNSLSSIGAMGMAINNTTPINK